MSFEKLKFWFRAKGRHGTHSPFVYAFVERVLRSKEIFKNCPKGFSQKSWQRLNATLRYLAVSEILFPEGFSAEIMLALSKNWPEMKMSLLSAGVLSIESGNLLLLQANDRTMMDCWLEEQLSNTNGWFSIYVLGPHGNEQAFGQVFSLKNNAAFKMVLDFWQGLLLVNSNDFKEKQFFELR